MQGIADYLDNYANDPGFINTNLTIINEQVGNLTDLVSSLIAGFTLTLLPEIKVPRQSSCETLESLAMLLVDAGIENALFERQ